MSNIVPFIFENHQVRVLTDADGKALFVAKDVAEALGYKDTVNAIKQHCRGVVIHHPIADALGRTDVYKRQGAGGAECHAQLPGAAGGWRFRTEERFDCP